MSPARREPGRSAPGEEAVDPALVHPDLAKAERRQHAVAAVAGLLFGAGLVLGGMTQPAKVIGFLDPGGQWDPSLALVMVGAIAVHALAYRIVRGRAAPLFANAFSVPTRRDLDAPLLLGAALFGVGWGLGGYCPGPGLVSLGSGRLEPLAFVLAFLAGGVSAEVGVAAWNRWRLHTRRRTQPRETAPHA